MSNDLKDLLEALTAMDSIKKEKDKATEISDRVGEKLRAIIGEDYEQWVFMVGMLNDDGEKTGWSVCAKDEKNSKTSKGVQVWALHKILRDKISEDYITTSLKGVLNELSDRWIFVGARGDMVTFDCASAVSRLELISALR